ncbi:MAG: divergent polysaccharide deacetylase family protein [Litorimonas sp.]
MSPTSPDPEPRSRRRAALALPKRRYPLLFGLALMGLIAMLLVWLSETYGTPDDAQARGSVPIIALSDADRPSPLDTDATGLPDLLLTTTPVGENPTDIPAPASTAKTIEIPEVPDPRILSFDTPPDEVIVIDPVAPPLDPSLRRQTPAGMVPGPNADGLTPLGAYKATPPELGGRRPVSLIVGGLGVNQALTRRAIRELPAAVTLSFAAQSEDLQVWMDLARAYGHEVLLEVPMEGANGRAGADGALTVSAKPDVNVGRLRSVMTDADGYVGLTHYQGDRFLSRSDAAAPVLSEIAVSGLAFFTDGSFALPSMSTLATSAGLPYRAGSGLIDPQPSRAVIEARLDGLSRRAKSQDGIIGVGFGYPQTIDVVKGWVATLSDDGLVLVPATATLP